VAGCNENCNCHLEAEEGSGLVTDGLGTAGEPYTIGTADGVHIPEAMTRADRLSLAVTAADQGLIVYETDTGLAYLYDGATYGWRVISVQAITGSAASTTLNQATSVHQSITSVTLTRGTWFLSAKAHIEASLDTGTGWDAYLQNDTDSSEVDQTSLAVSGGEVQVGAASYWRPFPLQAVVAPSAESTVYSLRVRRATTNGTQLVRFAKLTALLVPGNRV
jgi:hypothetical protein